MAELCAQCTAIFNEHHELPVEIKEPFKFRYGKYRLYDNVDAFLAAVTAGCAICKRIHREVQRGWWERLAHDMKQKVSISKAAFFHMEYALVPSDGSFRVEFEVKGCLIQPRIYKHINLPLRIVAINEAVGPLTGANLSTNTGPGQAWLLARQWLQTCLDSHQSCYYDDGDFQPTRLLYIGEGLGDPARLCHTKDLPSRVRYISLSHRWGNVQIFRLLLDNIQALEQALPLDILPKTFIDAIEVTRSLGAQYIWIDSLCIIQDDVDDWRHEAARMGDVYRYSWCNVAATGFEDSKRGMLVRRDSRIVAPLAVRRDYQYKKSMLPFAVQVMPTAGGSDLDPPAKFRSHAKEEARRQAIFPNGNYVCFDERFWERGITLAPLMGRGWVFQERLLSPRTLHFGAEQLFWECRETEACEAFPTGLPRDFHHGATYKARRAADGLDIASDLSSLQTALDAWNAVLASYTSASLTRQSDRLPALSGVAKDMQNVLKSKYLAGLWEICLLYQLLWRLEGPDRADTETSGAPSWSWASTAGAVIGNNLVPSPDLAERTVAKLVNANVQPVDDEMGEVIAGTITISGTLVHLFPTPKRFDILEYGQKLEDILSPWIFFWPYGTREYTKYSAENQGKPRGMEIDPVIYQDREKQLDEVYLLPIINQDSAVRGLVLVPVEPENLDGPWKRCGMFEFRSDAKGAKKLDALLAELSEANGGNRTIQLV
ncbi:heterokaryon incompatibility protein-domain-containing protein [Hypoxylon crocopeplum]|nr:heterokaryon incompatibility protein-domain-containing protein [Hypoxylon crocopeplum]